MTQRLARWRDQGKSRRAISVTREPLRVALAGSSEAPVKEKRKDSRRALLIGAGFGLLSIAFLAIAQYPAAESSRTAADARPKAESTDLVSGTITLRTTDRRCRKTTFDVKSGHVTEVSEIGRPCGDDDDSPRQAPMNVRIDAIGRSFVNR